MTTIPRTEPLPLLATLRETEDLETHIECWLSDGQKFAPIVVDAEFPELAQRLVEFLNASAEAQWSQSLRYRQLDAAVACASQRADGTGLNARRRQILSALHARVMKTTEGGECRADIIQRFGNRRGFEVFARQQGLDTTPVNPEEMRSRDGLFPATFFDDSTEYAWRGWANRS